jgi:hypothetical protein
MKRALVFWFLTLALINNCCFADGIIPQEVINKYFSKNQNIKCTETMKRLPTPDDSGRPFGLAYHVEDRSYALRDRRIYDDVSPLSLPSGSYTYVITQDGHISFGKVIDGWEFGVKHVHVANSRRVIAAGEIRSYEGNFYYNLDSSTFVTPIIKKKGGSLENLRIGVDSIFREVFKVSDPVYKAEVLLPVQPPTSEEYAKLCRSQEFKKTNDYICEEFSL